MLGACHESGTSPGPPGETPLVREMRIVVHYDTHVGNYDNGYPRSPMSETSFLILKIVSATSTATLSGPDSRCTDATRASFSATGGQVTIDFGKYSTSSSLSMSGARQSDASFRGTVSCHERPGPHSDSDEGSFVLEPLEMAPRPFVFLPQGFQAKVRDTIRVTPAVVTPPGAPSLGPWEFAFDSEALTLLPPDRFVVIKPGSAVIRVLSGGVE